MPRRSGNPANQLRAIAEAIRSLEPRSLFIALEAAASSPTAAHRLPSLAYVFSEAVRNPPVGEEAVTKQTILDLVALATVDHPDLAALEDFVPPDPRNPVAVRWGDNLYRIVAGSLERPIAAVERARTVGSVVDSTLAKHLGFGISDLTELVLTYVDQAVGALAPAWRKGPPPSPDRPAMLTEREIRAAAAIRGIDETPGQCTNPTRAKAALKWATAGFRQFRFDPGDLDGFFGSTIAVRYRSGNLRALPAPLCVEALNYAIRVLGEQAATLDSTLHSRYLSVMRRQVASLLARTGNPVIGPVEGIHSVVPFDRRHFLAIDVIGGLGPPRDGALGRAIDKVSAVKPGMQLPTKRGDFPLPADAKVVPLVVVAAPAHLVVPAGHGFAAMSVDDLDWIVYPTNHDFDDLFLFCEELANPQVGGMVSLETINAYEHWKDSGKCLHRFGVPNPFLFLELHRGDAEWYQAAYLYPLEKALALLGLGQCSSWDTVEFKNDEALIARKKDPKEGWHVSLVPRPLGLRVFDADTPAEDRALVGSLATSVVWRIRHTAKAFEELASSAVAGDSLRIVFLYRPEESVAERGPVELVHARNGEIHIAWDRRVYSIGLQDAQIIETMLGDAVSKGLSEMASTNVTVLVRNFLEAWAAAPPGLRLDAESVPQQTVDLPEPAKGHPAYRSRFLADLSRKLYATGVKAGSYQGDEAKNLESGVIYPILYELLHEALQPFDGAELVTVAITQVELASADRFRREKKLTWRSQFPVVDCDPIAVEASNRQEGLHLTRSQALLLEEVLRCPPTGGLSPSMLDWERLLSISELLLESGLRSETLHFGLGDAGVRIDQVYDVRLVRSNRPSLVDWESFQKAHVTATMPKTAEKETLPQRASSDGLLDTLPELRPIDVALRNTKGCGLDALLGVLDVLRAWPVNAEAPVGKASTEGVLSYCKQYLKELPESELAKSLESLTLRGRLLQGALLEHWEQDRRAVRLLTHPVVEWDGLIYIMPWLIGASMRIFLGYLSDGRLPWPNHSLEPVLVQALAQYRKSRNDQLEHEVVLSLRKAGLRVLPKVKKPKVLNIPAADWAGEIDALAIDDVRHLIWVIEVKDPYQPFSPAQIKGLISDFHEKGGYVEKLLLKTAAIAKYQQSVETALKCNSNARWSVQPLMVTRRPVPAAFIENLRVPFLTLDHLSRGMV